MSGYNLPDGVRACDPAAPWNEDTARECGTCTHWSGHGTSGICCLEFDDALCDLCANTPKVCAVAKIRTGAWWALDWVFEHLKDETSEACGRWKEAW